MSDFTLIQGDCREAMRSMADGSVDAIVTDPPYGLSFMGKKWDYQVPGTDAFGEMFRVLKPGGRLLCFAGTRTFHRMWCNIEDAGFTIEDTIAWMYGSGFPKHKSKLKPAFEPVCVARKDGVTALNIDACRIGTNGGGTLCDNRDELGKCKGHANGGRSTSGPTIHGPDQADTGRWPANVVLDEEAAAMLDEQSGERASGKMLPTHTGGGAIFKHAAAGFMTMETYGDTGGASRFFYCAKADRAEREHGLEGATKRNGGSTAKGFTDDVANGQDRNRPVANHHPTVKPVDLMRWLVRLVTTEGQTVLDPFMGSGTTGIACTLEGRHFIGCELNPEYVEMARKRIGNAQPSLFGGAA